MQRPQKRVLVTGSEAEVRTWAKTHGITLSGDVFDYNGQKCIAIRHVPMNIQCTRNDLGDYTQWAVEQNGVMVGIGLAKHDTQNKGPNGPYCVAPLIPAT